MRRFEGDGVIWRTFGNRMRDAIVATQSNVGPDVTRNRFKPALAKGQTPAPLAALCVY